MLKIFLSYHEFLMIFVHSDQITSYANDSVLRENIIWKIWHNDSLWLQSSEIKFILSYYAYNYTSYEPGIVFPNI